MEARNEGKERDTDAGALRHAKHARSGAEEDREMITG